MVPPPGLTAEDLHAISAYMAAWCGGLTALGDPVFVIRLSHCNTKVLMDQLGEGKFQLWLSYQSECAWQSCDRLTRTHGVLVQQLTLLDLRQSGAANRDRRVFRVIGQNSRTNAWLRPQLSGRIIIFNPPLIFKVFWAALAPLMSSHSLAKVRVHRSDVSWQPQGKLCPYAQQLLCADHLADMFVNDPGADDVPGSKLAAMPLALRRLAPLKELVARPQPVVEPPADVEAAMSSVASESTTVGPASVADSHSWDRVEAPSRPSLAARLRRRCCCRRRRTQPEQPLLLLWSGHRVGVRNG